MMQSRDGSDAIKMHGGEIPRHGVGNLKLKIRKLRGARARDPNHLWRKVERYHVPGPLSQTPRERARAATNFQRVLTVIGKVSQKDIVIVIVLRPALSVEQREAIEVCLNDGHDGTVGSRH